MRENNEIAKLVMQRAAVLTLRRKKNARRYKIFAALCGVSALIVLTLIVSPKTPDDRIAIDNDNIPLSAPDVRNGDDEPPTNEFGD